MHRICDAHKCVIHTRLWYTRICDMHTFVMHANVWWVHLWYTELVNRIRDTHKFVMHTHVIHRISDTHKLVIHTHLNFCDLHKYVMHTHLWYTRLWYTQMCHTQNSWHTHIRGTQSFFAPLLPFYFPYKGPVFWPIYMYMWEHSQNTFEYIRVHVNMLEYMWICQNTCEYIRIHVTVRIQLLPLYIQNTGPLYGK